MTGRNFESQRTALVTGAAGFIGSHLVEHLLATGWRVRGLDDFSAGRQENLRGVLMSPDFDLVEGSVLDERLVRTISAGATHVFHLAGRLGAFYVERHPEQTVLDSVQATRAILSVVRDHRIPLFFASTSEIYGDSDVQPLTEDSDIIVPPPTNPRSSYAFGKGVGELLVNEYVRREHGRAVIGRLFNTIGLRQSGQYGQVVPRFIEWALANQPIVVHGTGDQTRSFTSVDDVVRAIVATLTAPAANGQTINIGSCEETSIADLAQLVVRLTGSSSTVRRQPYDEAHGTGARDIRRRIPNTDQLRKLTGCDCVTPLESTIHNILEHSARPVAEGAV